MKSIDDFVKNDRLFTYAMKAFGLGDMAYAKAFMVKALKEGVSDPDSFANKLTDKRYAEFVSAFNFAALGANATSYNPAQQGVTNNYSVQVSARRRRRTASATTRARPRTISPTSPTSNRSTI